MDDLEKYRFDQYGSVYEYSENHNAYLFIGKLNGRTEEEFIENLDLEPDKSAR